MTNKQWSSYKDLEVWKKSITLVVDVYTITKAFPKEETYGLTSQVRRAAVSIPSNIAEGQTRLSNKEFCHFLRIAYSSAAELETQLIIAEKIGYITYNENKRINTLQNEVASMLVGLMKTLNTKSNTLNSKL